ncbi:hypothetical protein PMAYCL1PPCAC_09212, partial [Pristionchus mayeri]
SILHEVSDVTQLRGRKANLCHVLLWLQIVECIAAVDTEHPLDKRRHECIRTIGIEFLQKFCGIFRFDAHHVGCAQLEKVLLYLEEFCCRLSSCEYRTHFEICENLREGLESYAVLLLEC